MAVATAAEKSKAEQFVERTVQIMNDAGLALMMSIGHRTSLFDTMAKLPPSSVSAIAEAAALNPRYVKEWLGAMVTGGIVERITSRSPRNGFPCSAPPRMRSSRRSSTAAAYHIARIRDSTP